MYNSRGQYDKAIENYQQVLAIAKRLGTEDRIAIYLSNIGLVYYFQQQYDPAIKYLVESIELKEKLIQVTREVDEGLETIEINLPAIVTCDLRLNEPRYASLPNIMKAKKKPIDHITIDELGIDITPRTKQIKVSEPPKREKGIMVKDVAELVQKLKHEAKVI